MIVASILLILVAVVLLVAGLAGGSSALLITSIVASLLAAVALVVGARQAATARATAARGGRPLNRTRTTAYGSSGAQPEIPVQHVPSTVGTDVPGWRQPPEPPVTEPSPYLWPTDPAAEPCLSSDASADTLYPARETIEPVEAIIDTASGSPIDGTAVPPHAPAPTPSTGEAPLDPDPPAQHVSPVEVARLARLDDEVLVVDGRPRFHLPGCPHLVGRRDEALPVAEAVALGFTSCVRCAPATSLLADRPYGRSW